MVFSVKFLSSVVLAAARLAKLPTLHHCGEET